MEVGNQMTQELVDAFEKGQSELIYEPTPELLALENPYDWSQRDGIEYSWDHLLFEDKYYSYYGIAPVLLLFLPYHMITDYYVGMGGVHLRGNRNFLHDKILYGVQLQILPENPFITYRSGTFHNAACDRYLVLLQCPELL